MKVEGARLAKNRIEITDIRLLDSELMIDFLDQCDLEVDQISQRVSKYVANEYSIDCI